MAKCKYYNDCRRERNCSNFEPEPHVQGFPLDNDICKPFFAYGFLKRGEITHYIIEPFINDVTMEIYTESGSLYVKDGIPIFLKEKGQDKIIGQLIRFKEGEAVAAFKAINTIDFFQMYEWGTIYIDGEEVNVLKANEKIIDKERNQQTNETYISGICGGILIKPRDGEWHCSNDLFLNNGMYFLKNVFADYLVKPKLDYDFECDKLFDIQMHYMLLWTIIDRYNTLKYSLSPLGLTNKNNKLAADDDFMKNLWLLRGNHLTERRDRVYDSSQSCYRKFAMGAFKNFYGFIVEKTFNEINESSTLLGQKEKAVENAQEILSYYYKIRCNAVHRGKGVDAKKDYRILRCAFLELYAIMADMISKDLSFGQGDVRFLNKVIAQAKSEKEGN